MGEIRPVIALLHLSYQPQDIIGLEDWERQHHFQ
jgi:hypothetical protein